MFRGDMMLKQYDYDNMPIVDIVNDMIFDAARRKASDIHFDQTPGDLLVRIRVDGELMQYAQVPAIVKKNLITRIKIISGMNITESRLPQDGAIRSNGGRMNLDLRVSSLPTVYGEKIVIRILDYSMSLGGLETLGFSQTNLEKVFKIITKPNGIILVTGATGTGKSTTVYTMLQRLNTTSRNVITVEDPVEMKLSGVNQVQTMSEIGLTFAAALRSILRQDPDVIMIGEIRDNETARIAVRASITGHLVLSTIHTNNSLNTIERLADMDVERYLLGSALEGIISQRLCKRLCPKCRSSRKATEYEQAVFRSALHMEVTDIYTPVGCNECYQGYHGRVALHEVLLINQELRDAIVNNMKKEDLRHLIYEQSEMISILQDGLFKVMEGLTSFEEVLRVIDVDDDLGESDSDIKKAIIGKTDSGVETNSEASDSNLNDAKQILEPTVLDISNEKKQNVQTNTTENINHTSSHFDNSPQEEILVSDISNEKKQSIQTNTIKNTEVLSPLDLNTLEQDSLILEKTLNDAAAIEELSSPEEILDEIEPLLISESPLETLEDISPMDTLEI